MNKGGSRYQPQTLVISAVTERLFEDRIGEVLRSQGLDPLDVCCLVPQIYRRKPNCLAEVIPLSVDRYREDLEIPALANRSFARIVILFENNIHRFQNVVHFARRISAHEISMIDVVSGRSTSNWASTSTRARFVAGNWWSAAFERLPSVALRLLRVIMLPRLAIQQLRRRMSSKDLATSCPLCNSQRTEARYTFDATYRIRACRECTLYFQVPHPTPEDIARHFNGYGSYLDDDVAGAAYRDVAVPRYPAIQEAAANRPRLRILEIGCGNGAYLHNMKLRYPEMTVVGQEVDPISGQFARENSNCEVFIGNIAELELPVDYFDFVVAIQVIEHIPIRELKQVLPAISKTLKLGGSFVGDLPNFDSPPHRWLNGRWKNIAPLDHSSMLTAGSLDRLFREYGGFSRHEIRTSRFLNVAQIILNAVGIRDPKFSGMSRWRCKVGTDEGEYLVFAATR